MACRLLKSSDAALWDAACARLSDADIYFSHGYHAVCEGNGDGIATAFIFERGDDLFFYPFLLRPIQRVGSREVPDRYFDIETVYGYSGPLSSTRDEQFLNAAWGEFSRYCVDSGIIAEFVRFHPYAENHSLGGPGCIASFDRETVSVNLLGTDKEFWSRYPSGQRSKVRKAQVHGLTARVADAAEELDAFVRIYRLTMQNVGARDFYCFQDLYFKTMISRIGSCLHVVIVKWRGEPIAAALFMSSNGVLHYHLGGSIPAVRDVRPNNLLFHEAAMWGRRNGCRSLHLGGGRTSAPDDSLFAFKASISNERRKFFTGRRVHNSAVFAKLNALWLEQAGDHPRPNYFSLYRAPMSVA